MRTGCDPLCFSVGSRWVACIVPNSSCYSTGRFYSTVLSFGSLPARHRAHIPRIEGREAMSIANTIAHARDCHPSALSAHRSHRVPHATFLPCDARLLAANLPLLVSVAVWLSPHDCGGEQEARGRTRLSIAGLIWRDLITAHPYRIADVIFCASCEKKAVGDTRRAMITYVLRPGSLDRKYGEIVLLSLISRQAFSDVGYGLRAERCSS